MKLVSPNDIRQDEHLLLHNASICIRCEKRNSQLYTSLQGKISPQHWVYLSGWELLTYLENWDVNNEHL